MQGVSNKSGVTTLATLSSSLALLLTIFLIPLNIPEKYDLVASSTNNDFNVVRVKEPLLLFFFFLLVKSSSLGELEQFDTAIRSIMCSGRMPMLLAFSIRT